MKKVHFGGLDWVRLFAASLVMVFHFGVMSFKEVGPNYHVPGAPSYPELNVFDIGWVGVEIFFVLSGLVIGQSAEGRSAYTFLKGRIGRLLPSAWICATITLGVVIAFHMPLFGPVPSTYVKTLILYPNGPWISNVYWSLVVEVSFYSLIFFLLASNTFRHVERLAALLICLSCIYLAGVITCDWHLLKPYFLTQHGCFFGLGILLWRTSSRGFSLSRLTLIVVAIGACLAEICFVQNNALSGRAFYFAPTVWGIAVTAIGVSMLLPFNGGQISRTLGLMTYPIYLVHEKVGAAILRVAPHIGKWLALGLAIVTVLALSFLIVRFEYIVRPRLEASFDAIMMRLLRSTLSRYLKDTASICVGRLSKLFTARRR
jgi:peptidoglycan/LPS O-acetylase OafA/YrhL